jgi:hypothetical protein
MYFFTSRGVDIRNVGDFRNENHNDPDISIGMC